MSCKHPSVLRFIVRVGCARSTAQHLSEPDAPPPGGRERASGGGLASRLGNTRSWRCGAGRRRRRRDGAQITRCTTLRPYCRSHGRHARRSGKPTGALDCHAEPGKRQGRAASKGISRHSAPPSCEANWQHREVQVQFAPSSLRFPRSARVTFRQFPNRHTPVVAPIARAYFFTQLGAASPD